MNFKNLTDLQEYNEKNNLDFLLLRKENSFKDRKWFKELYAKYNSLSQALNMIYFYFALVRCHYLIFFYIGHCYIPNKSLL